MSKILYVGHYREGTGWGNGCLDYLLALSKSGHEVVARSINLNNNPKDVPLSVLQMEKDSIAGADYCIQHVLPYYMEYSGSFKKNIGIFYSETDSIKYTPWYSHLQIMDELWVPNLQAAEMCASELDNKVQIVPQPTNTDKYKIDYELINNDELKKNFIFYYIGESNTRKRISAIMRAFHTVFTQHDNVRLLIKAGAPNETPEQTHHGLASMEKKICDSLKLYNRHEKYQPAMFITDKMSDEGIMSLHATCDCFVLASYGESWCIPAFDAMGMNNHVIAPNFGGPADYLRRYSKGRLIGGNMTPVFGANAAVPEIQTGRENWFDVNITDLAKAMRNIYDEHINDELSSPINEYSYEVIGEKMGCLLSAK